MIAPPKLDEIARRISAHLSRFERNPSVNARPTRESDGKTRLGLTPYYHAGASARGARVGVWYVSFQHTSHLSKADALKYLAWLDAGNIGKHYDKAIGL